MSPHVTIHNLVGALCGGMVQIWSMFGARGIRVSIGARVAHGFQMVKNQDKKDKTGNILVMVYH